MHRKTKKTMKVGFEYLQYCWTKKALTFLWVVIVLTSWIYVSYSSSFFRQEKQALYYYGVRKHYKKAHTSIKSVCHKKCDFGFYLPNLLLFMLLLFYWSVNECKKPRVRRFGSYSVSKQILDFWISIFLNSWIFEFLDFFNSWFLGFWISTFLNFYIFGFWNFCISRLLDFCISGFLHF